MIAAATIASSPRVRGTIADTGAPARNAGTRGSVTGRSTSVASVITSSVIRSIRDKSRELGVVEGVDIGDVDPRLGAVNLPAPGEEEQRFVNLLARDVHDRAATQHHAARQRDYALLLPYPEPGHLIELRQR